MALLLAGTMTFSILGTGCGDKEKEEKKDFKDVIYSFSEVLEEMKASMNGEKEFGGKGEMTLAFGDGVTALLGTEIKPITLAFDENQKNKKSGIDIALKYDSNDLITGNAVWDHSNKNIYWNMHEFGDFYLKMSLDDVFNNNTMVDMSDPEMDTEVNPYDMKALENLDIEKLAKDIGEYIDLIKKKTPDPKKVEKVTGEIDKHKYKFDAKTYEITNDDLITILSSVIDKAKKDSFLKDLLNTMGLDVKDYEAGLKELIADDNSSSDENENLVFTAFYNDDELAGIKIDDENLIMDIRIIDEDDVCAIDAKMKIEEDEISIFGSAKAKDGKFNGKYDLKFNINDSELGNQTINCSFKLKDAECKDDVFNGTIEFGMDIDTGFGVTISPVITLKSNSTKDKADVSLNLKMQDVDYATFSMVIEMTDAKDVALPTGKVYDMKNEKDMETVSAEINANMDTFLEKVRTVIGEDLYNVLTATSSSETYDYDEDMADFDFNYDADVYNVEIGDNENMDVLQMAA